MPLSKSDRQQLSIMWDFTLPEAERIRAVSGLANTGNRDLAVSFIELLRLDRSPAMRRSAIAALGRTAKVSPADMSVVKILEKLASSDQDSAIRSEAEIAIAHILKRYENFSCAGKCRPARKRKSGSDAGKKDGASEGDKSWVIDSELVSQTLKGPG